MHSAALLAAMVAHGLIMPPVEKQKGGIVNVPQTWLANDIVITGNGDLITVKQIRIYRKHENARHPWADGDIFKAPIPDNLAWSGFSFSVRGREGPDLDIDVIDCVSEKEAKLIFLCLRLRRVPDYARSGRFLIKAGPEAFPWFANYYGADRYTIHRAFTLWGYPIAG